MIFGVSIEGLGWGDVSARLDAAERLWLVTANPEILLEARRDATYRAVLRSSDVRTVDGFGLFLAMKILRRKIRRLTGVELSEHLIQYAQAHGWKVGLLGGENGEAERSVQALREAYPGLEVLAEQGGQVESNGSVDSITDEAVHRMTLFAPDVLLVAFGHPKQEFWIAKNRAQFPSVKVVVGVGGTFNFWAGTSKRAPRLFRSIGLEWLWRLFHEPRRWRRIMRAVLVFPALFIVDRIRPIR